MSKINIRALISSNQNVKYSRTTLMTASITEHPWKSSIEIGCQEAEGEVLGGTQSVAVVGHPALRTPSSYWRIMQEREIENNQGHIDGIIYPISFAHGGGREHPRERKFEDRSF